MRQNPASMQASSHAELPELSSTIERHESNVRSYSRKFPAVFHRGKGAELFDARGRRWVDFFCGAGALNYGHNPDLIKRRVLEYLNDDHVMHALDASTTAKVAFLEEFSRTVLAPRGLDYKVQCCGPTGTDAVEAALKLSRRVTGRVGVFAFMGAYHGVSLGSLSLTSNRALRQVAGVPLHNVTFVPYFLGPRGAFDSVKHIEMLLEDPHSGVEPPAAIVLEPVQMEGGVFAAPLEALQQLRKLCDRHGIMLVCDEIQTGCGRTGRFFMFERAGIVPDLVTVSKSISGYGFPMSLLLIRREMDRWNSGDHPGTFRGHQLSFVGGTAALEFWRDPDFISGLAAKEALLSEALGPELRKIHPELELRGVGLAWGIDFSRVGGGEIAHVVSKRAFEHGLLIECCGRGDSVVKLLPPLTASPEILQEGCAILLLAIRRALNEAT
jgi:diaminobutyrate-2-oxoglutarate transaminase